MCVNREGRPKKWLQRITPLKRRVNRVMKRGILVSTILLLMWGTPVAFGSISPSREGKLDRKTETAFRILPVLEERIGDPDVLAMTKHKLFTLHDKDIRLISSLCDRISAGERTARADVVFSLVTTLIVLS
jgi:hypothetical protein